MSVNAKVQAIKVLVTCHPTYAPAILATCRRNKRIINKVNSGKITPIEEVETDLIGISIIGESRSRHMLFNSLCHWPISRKKVAHLFLSLFLFFSRSNNNRRFNNYNRGGGGEHFQRGGDFNQRGGGSDYNNHNNNNRYQNGDSDRGGNWNNRGGGGGSRTFTRSSGAENRFQGPPPQQQGADGAPLEGDAQEAPRGDEPVNNRWQEPAQQDNYYNNRSGGYGGKWNSRGGEVDYTIPLERDERIELELFGTANTGINFNKYEDIPVEATGKDVPEHITTFDDIKLTDIIRENVKMARYDKPTPVQKYAIPIIIGGRDLMSCAQTGSG